MLNNTTTREILNDLIQVNNDRITGYEKAIAESTDENQDLKSLFALLIAEGHHIRIALATEVQKLGGNVEQGTTTSGKIYRIWMDVQAIFTGHDRLTILENCEIGETAIREAYRSALEDNELPAYIRELLSQQLKSLKTSHEEMRAVNALIF